MKPRLVRLLAIASMLLAGVVLAQSARFVVTFETLEGEPTTVEGYASGDHLVLRVEVLNDSDTVLDRGAFWVGFPPVEGATLHSSTVGGFSSPERIVDPEGNDVESPSAAGVHTFTHLHELPEALGPGEVGAIKLKVTVLSSRNELVDVADEVFLVDAEGRHFGTRVDDIEAP